MNADPHSGSPVLAAGRPLGEARAAMLLLHGRGADGHDMLGLAGHLHHPDLAYLAPTAPGRAWYPDRFIAPREANEPWLSSALARVAALVDEIAAAGVPPERQMLVGFSQGACLASDFVARHPRRYGALAALTGGLIGPPGTVFDHPGDLAGTPVHLAAGDPDPHVPWWRVEETAEASAPGRAVVELLDDRLREDGGLPAGDRRDPGGGPRCRGPGAGDRAGAGAGAHRRAPLRAALRRQGAEVDLHRFPGLGHTIHPNSLAAAKRLIHQFLPPDRPS